MDIRRNFLKGVMDKDSDERLVPEGVVRDALNIRMLSSENGDVGAIENCLGNEKITDLSLGRYPATVGSGKDSALNCIYWLVKSEVGSYFIEYNLNTGVATKILEDTRSGNENVLNLNTENRINKIVIIIDTDNSATYAAWTDNHNPIRFVNIERAKGYGENGFAEEDITLIKKPPLNKPSLSPRQIDGLITTENNISEKFLSFAYRWVYLDGEYSSFSPFTTPVFTPKPFEYNFGTNSNESMINSYHEVFVGVNTGSHLVAGIELLFKESNNDTVYKTTVFKKSDEGWDDNTDVEIVYNDKKIHGIVPESQLKRLYDAVPNRAFCLEYIGGQLMVGHYSENYNLIDASNNPVVIDLELALKSESQEKGKGYSSVKSIRDYEVGIVYADEYGRLTSVLTSERNTINVPSKNSDKQNKLQVSVGHKAPYFAKKYRFFIKQSREHYDTLVCTQFYEDDQYVWVRLASGEKDKIKEGEYLIVKSDTSGILNSYVETRVLEITDQPNNFLDENHEGDIPAQLAGTYFKIEPKGYRMSIQDRIFFSDWSRGRSQMAEPVLDSVNYIEDPIYYGVGVDQGLSSGGTYTESDKDVRIEIEIDGDDSSQNTFRWSIDNGANWTSYVPITGNPQSLIYGIEVTFDSSTENVRGDKWVVSAKGSNAKGSGTSDDRFGDEFKRRGYAFIQGPVLGSGTTFSSEDIKAGAQIVIHYEEHGRSNATDTQSFIATRDYANIEEWWINDFIESKFNISFHAYWFRRGTRDLPYSDDSQFTVDPDGPMFLCVMAKGRKKGSKSSILVLKIEIIQSDKVLLFETKSQELDSDIFYEIGETYDVDVNGYHVSHKAGDISQSASNGKAVITLDWFNCFGWGNGFESYKIKDALNAKDLGIGSRAHSTVEDYKENNRRSSITWSGVFEQTVGYNALNEFNLSKTNYIDLDDAFGSIQYLHSKDTNLIAFQENRVQPLGYRKTEFFDQSGNPTMVKSDQVLNIMNAYSGEYGISNNPESFAVFGNRVFWIDSRRGSPMRLSQDGIFELSKHGHKSFFKNMFRNHPDRIYHGAYDPYFDEYIISIYSVNPIKDLGVKEELFVGSMGYSQDATGWTSRYSFLSEGMVGVNNNFYSFKRGQLYKHNSKNVPRNNFYGVQNSSFVSIIFNDSPSDDKIFKALSLEGNKPWEINLKTNLTKGSILAREFERRESRWFAYTRRNETSQDFSGLNANGLGNAVSTTYTTITLGFRPSYLSSGDQIFQLVNGVTVLIGVVVRVDNTVIHLTDVRNPPVLGAYCFGLKNARAEGGSMRGYFMEAVLENSDTEFVELFSVGTKIAKSYV